MNETVWWLFAFLVLVVNYFLGYKAGWDTRGTYTKQVVKSVVLLFEKDLKEQQKHVVNIKIVRHGGIFLIYNDTTGDFLTQGRDKEEVVKNLSDRYPGITFMADKANAQKEGLSL